MRDRLSLYVRSALSLIHIFIVKLCNPRGFLSPPVQDFSLTTRICVRGIGTVSLGRHIHTKRNVVLMAADSALLEIGDGCFFNNGCMAVAKECISIGKNSAFGPNVMIYDHDHDIHSMQSVHDSGFVKSPIVIGDNVWVGANSVILRGTRLGDGCVVGAGSVVKGSYPPGSVIIQKRSQTVSAPEESEVYSIE